MATSTRDTIVAQATAPGKGGVGIVRVSGPQAKQVAHQLLRVTLSPRQATYTTFYDHQGQAIDQGIALLFVAPHSFTGEDVLELQGHGGQVVMDLLVDAILQCSSTRLARPGEFSEQAFLNDKLDLTQAEAIADLINATSIQAAKSALLSLKGEFSKAVHALGEEIVHLRMYVEAAIDFPDEEIDFLNDGHIASALSQINDHLAALLQQTQQGVLLRDGMQVVIAGRPNAGKSSLLNALAGRESAIVTDIAGTTRDVLREHIHINGMPLHIIDTAGLRESDDKVEQIGIARAWDAIRQADQVLLVVDGTDFDKDDPQQYWPEFLAQLPDDLPVTVIRNKADITGDIIGQLQRISVNNRSASVLSLSAAEKRGIDELRQHLAKSIGLQTTTEGQFIARRRHLQALYSSEQHLKNADEQLHIYNAGELVAEELRLAHQCLCEITGEFSSDDLLSRIFSSFCIGK